jgi:NitT/TauT family transport system permease protein
MIFLVALALWEAISGPLIDPFWLSRPSSIAVYLYDWVHYGDFFRHFWFTMAATLGGFVLGIVFGLLTGLPLGRAERLARILDPFLTALNGIPRAALAPLFVVWFGIGLLPKIVLVFTLVYFVVFYNAYSGVRYVERRYLDLAWAMGANPSQLFRKVIFPAALPYILLGVKLSIPYALIGAIIGEFVASSAGLGYKLQVETGLYNTTGTMAGIIVLMAIVVVLNAVLAWVESRALAWRPLRRDGAGQGTTAI